MSYERLVNFAAGDLTGQDAAAVEVYLAHDPEAAKTVSYYRLAVRTIQTDDGVNPSPATAASAKAIFDHGQES